MKIKFTYSHIFQKVLGGESLKPVLIRKKIDLLNNFWNKNGKKIEKNIKQITGLSFKDDDVCYINSVKSFSKPLTLKIDKDMFNTLIHELCHVILTQNEVYKNKRWKKYEKDFKGENPLVISHILVHSIHKLISGNKAFKSKHPDYIRSWEIVKKMGAKNLIDKYLVKKIN